jgi:hypothetical protein
MTEDEVRVLLNDENIVYPIQRLIAGGYNLEQIKHVFIQLTLRELNK